MNEAVRDVSVPNSWDRRGLPGWCYHSPALLELEKEHIFRTHWQIVCHISDLPDPGSYLAFDMCGERALVLRDKDGEIRAFHNICRHRGSRLVIDDQGTCPKALVCPFHGWVYNLDGTLRGAARPETFPDLDKDEFALRKVELEIWNGFVFIRFKPGPQPSVAEVMAPIAEEVAGYDMASYVPTDGFWVQESPVNWKSVRDVDNEGYHVALAHPALQDLYGATYNDQPYVAGLSRSVGQFTPTKGRRWAVRQYKALSDPGEDLPPHLHKTWNYYGIFPNAVIGTTPETIQFYQEFPLTTGTSLLRGKVYRRPDESRQQRVARYLAARIDRETVVEDTQLTVWSNEAMASTSFEGFYLSDLEYGVRTHHNHLRNILPVYNLQEEPEDAALADVNASLQANSKT